MKTDEQFIKEIYDKAQCIRENEEKAKDNRYTDSILQRGSRFRIRMYTAISSIVVLFLIFSIGHITKTNYNDSHSNKNLSEAQQEEQLSRNMNIRNMALINEQGKILDHITLNSYTYILVQKNDDMGYRILRINAGDNEAIKAKHESYEGTTIQYTFVEESIKLTEKEKEQLKKQFGTNLEPVEWFEVTEIHVKE